ncbi:uncharacterized protein Z519_06033 [Cladophialophora bantiana CBS 173.52]|uniref:Uncharacterized protein n=1 Tax=Cladophialophora bantiana (strain ATCC 10958 / CBS 173.52 / CDC B-1940 / NIH 8579) TaxID=1442370 RepID=A0A0D2HJG3_CLAB1|nr:uncharacterized protein Z519_06033 [Cladophialophora bantiana CBS 173.52]KIW93428.1 hypothetical protein Z519_06033 [Cladophialophora bantiana CBS 173.52]
MSSPSQSADARRNPPSSPSEQHQRHRSLSQIHPSQSAGPRPDPLSSLEQRQRRHSFSQFLLRGDTGFSTGLSSPSSGSDPGPQTTLNELINDSASGSAPTSTTDDSNLSAATTLVEALVDLRRVHAATDLTSLLAYPQITDVRNSDTDALDIEHNSATTRSQDNSFEPECADRQAANQANNSVNSASLFWSDEPSWSFHNIPGPTVNSAYDLPNSLPTRTRPNSLTTPSHLSSPPQVHSDSSSTPSSPSSPITNGYLSSLSTPDLPKSVSPQERTISPSTPTVDPRRRVNPLFPRPDQVTGTSQASQPSDVIMTRRLRQREPGRRVFTTPIPANHDGGHRSATDPDVGGSPGLRRVGRSGSLRSLARDQAEADATTVASEEAEDDDGASAQGEWQAPEDYLSSGGEDDDDEEGGRVNLDEIDAPVAEQLRAGLAHLSEVRVEIDVLDGDLPIGAARGNHAAVRARTDLVLAEGEIRGAIGSLWRSLLEAREIAVDAEAGIRRLQDEVARLATDVLESRLEAALASERAVSNEALLERAQLEIAVLRERLREREL